MQDFLKNILNYYAAFTETRFSSRSTLKYQWTNDVSLTLDISFFPEFRRLWLDKIASVDAKPVDIRPRQYAIPLSVPSFRERLESELHGGHDLNALKGFIRQETEREPRPEPPPEEREIFLEGIRQYNLTLRKAIEGIVRDLQKESLERLQADFLIRQFPPLSLNLRNLTQEIFRILQGIAQTARDEDDYFGQSCAYLQERDYDLPLYDLFFLLSSYRAAGNYGTVYLFFDSIGGDTDKEKGGVQAEYPLFFIEVTFGSEAGDSIRLQIPKDFILINTPALNTFEFDSILTLPRASSFKEAIATLTQMDRSLSAEYQVTRQGITLSEEFYQFTGKVENRPPVRYRLGFQVIRDEDKRLLDYSELMTRVEKGMASKLGGFVDTYVHKNVINTTEDTERNYRERYPSGSSWSFIADNPLPLNIEQKKILLALANHKNRVITVGGPPGTGKSHTIAAIAYWANQNDRSVVITSHKQEALGVVDRMLSDKFRDLHPMAKPSIIRLTRSVDFSKISALNEITNSLAQPAIDAAVKRAASFSEAAVNKDKQKIEEQISTQVGDVIKQARKYPDATRDLMAYLALEEDLRQRGILDEETGRPARSLDEEISCLEEFVALFNNRARRFDKLSLHSLAAIFREKEEIQEVLKACEAVNQLSFAKDWLTLATPDRLEVIPILEPIIATLSDAFDDERTLLELQVIQLEVKKTAMLQAIPTLDDLRTIVGRLNELANLNPTKLLVLKNQDYVQARDRFADDFPVFDEYQRKRKRAWKEHYRDAAAELDRLAGLKQETAFNEGFLYRLCRESYDFVVLAKARKDFDHLRFKGLIEGIAKAANKDPGELSLREIGKALEGIKVAGQYAEAVRLLADFQKATGLEELDHAALFTLLEGIQTVVADLKPQMLDALRTLNEQYAALFMKASVTFDNLGTLFRMGSLLEDEQKLYDLIKLNAKLSGSDGGLLGIDEPFRELYRIQQRITEHQNDLRLKNLLQHAGDAERIKASVSDGKRLTTDYAKLLLASFACIIAEPEALFRYFPMEEDLIDILIFDEASQVSIAHSISLILRAKQVVVFGDEYQYGAVGAVTVSRKYAQGYFRKILDSYKAEFHGHTTPEQEEKIIAAEADDTSEEEQCIPGAIPVDAGPEWIRTFGIRNSTLNFCRAIANYRTTLTEHFRSFKEIIDYSNKYFYEVANTPLIVNRLRTKPITDVLRFIRVETKGRSGKHVNLDELEAIRLDLEMRIDQGFKGTIGIITSFDEQQQRAEKYFREHLKDYPRLKEEQKLNIWFVGDVQGEERDIVYYTFVEDKNNSEGGLRSIYPIPAGTADKITSLKMQRLNVGFSRARDTMVFVHSMPLEDYMDTRLGDALRFYWTLLEDTKRSDHFIVDENIFESPKEKELYQLLLQTEYYQKNRERMHIIPQFDIGRYIAQEYKKYIPKYRVDFLVTLTDGGRERSLILEYDGLEYHTKDPSVVRSLDDFREEYLEYDIRRQLELESYGYRFLRINKFSLAPGKEEKTRLDVLNGMIEKAFAV
ncbi:MAG: AAA domain-containing protein [Syntrophales bacterium]